jgi:hypothetical protein
VRRTGVRGDRTLEALDPLAEHEALLGEDFRDGTLDVGADRRPLRAEIEERNSQRPDFTG